MADRSKLISLQPTHYLSLSWLAGMLLSFSMASIYRWHIRLLLRHRKVHMFQKAFLPKKIIIDEKIEIGNNCACALSWGNHFIYKRHVRPLKRWSLRTWQMVYILPTNCAIFYFILCNLFFLTYCVHNVSATVLWPKITSGHQKSDYSPGTGRNFFF